MRFTIVILAAMYCLSAAANEVESSDEAIIAAAEKIVSEDASAVAQIPTATSQPIPESQIPVFQNKSPEVSKPESTDLTFRLLASLGILIMVGAGTLIYARRYRQQRGTIATAAKIEVLHQYNLTPKRTLSLVRVAGEVLLLGSTDHAVNLIKPILLVNEELEQKVDQDFNSFLEDEFQIEDVKKVLNQ